MGVCVCVCVTKSNPCASVKGEASPRLGSIMGSGCDSEAGGGRVLGQQWAQLQSPRSVPKTPQLGTLRQSTEFPNSHSTRKNSRCPKTPVAWLPLLWFLPTASYRSRASLQSLQVELLLRPGRAGRPRGGHRTLTFLGSQWSLSFPSQRDLSVETHAQTPSWLPLPSPGHRGSHEHSVPSEEMHPDQNGI